MSRLANGHFAPGHSGNSGGRPRIPDDIKAMLKDLVPDSVRAYCLRWGSPRPA